VVRRPVIKGSDDITRPKLDSLFMPGLQREWAIYLPLICKVVDTSFDAQGDEFAEAVTRWQRSMGLQETGLVDAESWSRMVKQFQSRRITERAYPTDDKLTIVPSFDFYHPERPPELRRVETNAYRAYKRMVAAALEDQSLGLRSSSTDELHPDEKYLKIISAFRSREYQDSLRKAAPKAGRAALAINSPHFTGRALDLYVGGDPVSSKDSNRLLQTRGRVYQWLVKNAERFDFYPYFYEPWHWEYIPTLDK
jgi:uncharacterized protein YcbK (DUF882 family)